MKIEKKIEKYLNELDASDRWVRWIESGRNKKPKRTKKDYELQNFNRSQALEIKQKEKEDDEDK